MTEAAAKPAPAAGLHANSGVGGSRGGEASRTGLSASQLNDFRISAVIDRLRIHLHIHNKNDPVEFLNLCLSLSRGIDFAIANHMVASRAREMPSFIKKVCQIMNDADLQAAILILMISVKGACRSGWFSEGDSEELSNLAKEIASKFGSVSDFNTEPSCSLSVISTVMPRFYPRMKMGHIFVSLEIKPGFDAYLSDFPISKTLKSSPGDKIRLFVVQTDCIETSSCLITPAKANFLLNGKGVDRRTNIFLDTGPQIPTDVTSLLKYGSNLLQAVGEFNGNYIIAIAFMSEVPIPDSNTLQDYEQHASATVDADSEVIEGPSRVSLNCPISFGRIKTPVKGHLCKHIQCFDFDNYVDINSRRPSWRCPHCNQHVCFSDVRIDQKMVKVLEEVKSNVSSIIISSDWSWSAVAESEDTAEKPEDNTLNTGVDECPQPADIVDLTETDDAMDAVPTCETEDIKISRRDSQFVTQTTIINPQMVNTIVNQSSGQAYSDFWSGFYRSTSSNVQSSEQTAGVSLTSSFLTESIPPITETQTLHHITAVTTSALQSRTSLPDTLQLQQYQFGNPSVTNEYGRFPSNPGHMTKTPAAVQALPALSPTSALQRSFSNGLNPLIQNGISATSQVLPAIPNLTTVHANPCDVPPTSMFSSPSPSLQHSSMQQNSPFPSGRPPHQNVAFLDMYRVSNEHHSSAQQMANLRVPRGTSQSPVTIPSSPMQYSGSFLRPQNVSARQSHPVAAANRAVQMPVDASSTVLYSRNASMPATMGHQMGISGAASSQPVNYDPTDLSWRSGGRMRGALSGQAYDNYYSQIIGRSDQQAQAARPISNMTAAPTPRLQAVMAGGVVRGIPASVGWPMGSDVLLTNDSSGEQ